MNSATQRPRASPSFHAQVRTESKRTPKRRLQNGGESFYSIEVDSFYVVKANPDRILLSSHVCEL